MKKIFLFALMLGVAGMPSVAFGMDAFLGESERPKKGEEKELVFGEETEDCEKELEFDESEYSPEKEDKFFGTKSTELPGEQDPENYDDWSLKENPSSTHFSKEYAENEFKSVGEVLINESLLAIKKFFEIFLIDDEEYGFGVCLKNDVDCFLSKKNRYLRKLLSEYGKAEAFNSEVVLFYFVLDEIYKEVAGEWTKEFKLPTELMRSPKTKFFFGKKCQSFFDLDGAGLYLDSCLKNPTFKKAFDCVLEKIGKNKKTGKFDHEILESKLGVKKEIILQSLALINFVVNDEVYQLQFDK
jgi:hypothetical protein